MIQNAMEALPGLGFLGLAVGAVAVARLVFGDRSDAPKADEHDLSDYHEPAPAVPSFSFMLAERGLAQMREDLAADDVEPCTISDGSCRCHGRASCEIPQWERDVMAADDILPPAPEGMNAGSPLYAEMLFDTWFPESTEDRVARYLREIRDEALAGAR